MIPRSKFVVFCRVRTGGEPVEQIRTEGIEEENHSQQDEEENVML